MSRSSALVGCHLATAARLHHGGSPWAPGSLRLAGEAVISPSSAGVHDSPAGDLLARRQALKRGNVVLDDETAAGLKLSGHRAEALHLLILAGQVGNRIAHQES